MAEKIKKFFQRKKLDAKFKLAGPGHRLDASESSSTSSKGKEQSKAAPRERLPPSDATKQAAEAALARLNSQKKDTAFNTSLAAIQAQVRRELEAEKKTGKEKCELPVVRPVETTLEASPHLAVNGVYFRCPMISDEVLTKEEWKSKLKTFLFAQLEEERGITACLIIYSCNNNIMKVRECADILCKYLENIITNPDEVKYQKIRCANATFRDKVEPVLGATEFLYAAGFRNEELDNNGTTEQFWVFHVENVEGVESLMFLRDAIKSEDRIELEVDRGLQVLSPAQADRKTGLPDDFYAVSKEEIKKEQMLRAEAVEKSMQLRTKAMREKDELREIRRYKFSLIRVRFPDGIYLQGTFSAYEKFSKVLEYTRECLENDLPFVLTLPTGQIIEEEDYEKSLMDLRLVPATILNFKWDPSLSEDITDICNTYLKPEIMMLIQQL